MTDDAPRWPLGLDDLRRHPDRLVGAEDSLRLGIISTHRDLKRLPAPLRLPGGGRSADRGWEARTILAVIGAEVSA